MPSRDCSTRNVSAERSSRRRRCCGFSDRTYANHSLDGVGVKSGKGAAELRTRRLKRTPRTQAGRPWGKIASGSAIPDRRPGVADLGLDGREIRVGGAEFLDASITQVKQAHHGGPTALSLFDQERVEPHLELRLFPVACARRGARLVVDHADGPVWCDVQAVDDPPHSRTVGEFRLESQFPPRGFESLGILEREVHAKTSSRVVEEGGALSRVGNETGNFGRCGDEAFPLGLKERASPCRVPLIWRKIKKPLEHCVHQSPQRGGPLRSLGEFVDRTQAKEQGALGKVASARGREPGLSHHGLRLGETSDASSSDYRDAMNERRTKGLVAGRVLGAPVIVQPSTLVMLAVLSYIFASSSGETTTRTLTIGLVLAVALIGSVFLHEVAHAIAARSFGRRVNEIVLTLWGGHTSFDARGVTPLVNGVTALAGPFMNLLIMAIARITIEVTRADGLTGAALAYVAWANLLLAIFNVLPGIPMDGGRVLESIVWGATGNQHRGTLVSAWMGRIVAIGVVLYTLGAPFFVGRRPGLFDVVIAMVIFSVLWPAASSAIAYSKVMLRRDSVTVAVLMVPAVAVPYTVTVEEARRAAEAAGASEIVVLGADDAPAGRFPLALTDQVPEESRAHTSLQAVTTPIPRGAHIAAAATADVLMPQLREWWGKTDVLVVREDEAVIGIVRLVDVVAALS